jgi:hypothetical protein
LRRALRAAAGGILLSLPALADGPVLHEYFEPDPDEDLRLSATTPDGSMPAAIQTPVGVVAAPPPGREATRDEVAYGGSSTPDSVDASYQIDRDTRRPERVGYDDPFTPAIAPFKRLYAYDAVDDGLELVVSDKDLLRIPIGGEVRLGEDAFYADLFVDLVPHVPVRIPSVGPGARVLAAQLDPPVVFELLRDGADNWFLASRERKRARLVMQLAIARAVFASPFGNVSWEALEHLVQPLPAAARRTASRVLEHIGVSRKLDPPAALAQLVRYHRSFIASDELPHAGAGAPLYEELSLSQKGVCRHRAYAFVITAHALGLPARLVRNEAHAWVEVSDSQLWHRIDLGGAAGELSYQPDSNTPLYEAPSDPFPWPGGSQTGQQMAVEARARAAPSGGTGPGPAPAASSLPNPTTSDAAPPGTSAEGEDARDADDADDGEASPSAELTLTLEQPSVRRGSPVTMRGQVSAAGEPCPFARVDVALRGGRRRATPIAALPTDAEGRYSGQVSVPLNVAVGDYEIVVSTPGAGACGPSR